MDEHLLAKVRALLAKAESTEFEAEAEAFSAKAMELIARHGIDEALLAASGAKSDVVDKLTVDIDNPYSYEKATLLTAVAQSMRCKAITSRNGKTYSCVTVVGFASDLERVNLLYTSLLLQATSQVTRQRPTPAKDWHERSTSTVAYRKSWFAGFNNSVFARLREAERSAASHHSPRQGVSTEIVLRDRSKVVAQEFAQLFPNARTYSGRRTISSEGYSNGKSAGERADLNDTRIGSRRHALSR